MFDFDAPPDRRGTNSIKWADAGGDRLAMGLADMDFRAAPVIIDALRARVAHGVFGYTEPGPGFYEAVTAWMAARRGWPVDAAWITPGPGIMPSMAHVLRGVLEPGAGVIVQTPAFAPIPEIVEQNGFQVVENPLRLTGTRYEMDVDGLLSAARRSEVRALVLCSPHNPIGRVWTREELATIAEICSAHDLLVVSDEIHAEVVFPWASFVTYPLVAGPAARHATLFGPSKGFNLPGLRTSVTVIADEVLRTAYRLELHRVNEDFGIGVLGAAALEAAYTRGGDWLDALADYLRGNLETLTGALEAHLPEVSVIRPDASFLVWLDCRRLRRSSAELARRIGEEAGVIVEPGTSFGAAGEGFMRVNIATARRRVEDAAERMAATLGG